MEHAPLWSWKGFGAERGERHQLTTGFHSESPSASLKCFSFLFEAQIGTLYLSWEKEVFQTEKKMIVVTTSLEKEVFRKNNNSKFTNHDFRQILLLFGQ